MQNGSNAIMQAANLFVFGINNPVRWVDPSGLFIISAMVNPAHNFGLGPVLGIGPIINHNPIVGVNTGAGTSVNQSSAGAGTSVSQGSVVGATSSQVTSVNMILIGTQFFGLAAACPTKRKLDTGGSGGGGKSPGGGTRIPSGAGVPTPPTRIVTPQPIPKTQTATNSTVSSQQTAAGQRFGNATLNSGATMRERLLNTAQNTSLRNTISELYRSGAGVGDGGLAAAVRHELSTGQLVGGKSHIAKATERITNLEKIISNQNLNQNDLAIAEQLLRELTNALGR